MYIHTSDDWMIFVQYMYYNTVFYMCSVYLSPRLLAVGVPAEHLVVLGGREEEV